MVQVLQNGPIVTNRSLAIVTAIPGGAQANTFVWKISELDLVHMADKSILPYILSNSSRLSF